MANLGFMAGGLVQGYQAGAGIKLQKQQLALQQKALQQEQQQQLAAQVDKATANSMQLISDTIKNGAEGIAAGDELSLYGDAIASIESDGSGGYQAIGPVTKNGDRAYGKYQVMGANIPSWTQEVLGKAMSPQEFLANKDAQDAVFKAKFSQFVQQYGGPEDAASVWFTGKPAEAGADAQDINGTTGSQYVQKFVRAVNEAPKQKLRAAVTPILQSVQAINQKAGRDPSIYSKQVDAMLAGVVMPAQKAVVAGQAAARQKIAETNSLISAGIDRASAMATAGIENKAPGADIKPLDPKDVANIEEDLRKEYTKLSSDFTVVRDSYERIQNAYQNPTNDTGVSDIGLIFSYMKMLDPNSVVRESEYATVGNAQGVPAQIRTLYNRALAGSVLDQKTRDDILKQATVLFETQNKQHDKVRDNFTKIAERTGVDPANIVIDFGTNYPPQDAAGGQPDPLGIR